ncbi:natural cytotoxicity triggering receptor 3-like [Emydura macquarii macquarii]|uniref:natural cytotoxicity triggering receptor 3-like n=1 Tax=Emydura macquarii macquarii TaxID=1129001 RepID=UPI00352A0A1E
MEQLPALSPVLCLVLLIPSWGADGLRVSQQPRSLNATAGDNLTLTCTFQNRDGSRVKALWLRGSGEDVVLDSNHPFYRGRLHVSSLNETTQGKATLTLSELEERDSGLYLCCIEIESEQTGTGEDTELRVTQGKPSATGDILAPGNNGVESQPKASAELIIYRAVIALAAVSIIILAGTLVLHRRKAAATETPPQPHVKRDRRPGNDASEDLHYAEITVKAPAHTKYASVCTQRL